MLSACSFDNKSGIWDNQNSLSNNKKNEFSDFKNLIIDGKQFDKIIEYKKNFRIFIDGPVGVTDWSDIYYDKSNNLNNFKYDDLNEIVGRSKKISRYNIDDNFLLENNNIILTDQKGNLIVYSLKKNTIEKKFNFYKKKFKNIKKKLNIIIENGVIYVSDNIGFLYAYDYKKDLVIWAKNYKVPFRSNLKISKNKLIASNQNNNLFFYDKKNGNILKMIPTEETIIKNKFINNISLINDNTFFLNTYGSLYSINNNNMKIIWFLNLNQSLDLNPSSLFFGSEVIIKDKKAVISTNKFLYVIDINTGSIQHKRNFSTKVKPIIAGDYLFLLSKNNLLINMNIKTGEVIYSYDINKKISDFLNIKKKEAEYKTIMIVNSKIFIFLKNSFVIKLSIEGEIENIFKLPSKMNSNPIFSNNEMIYVNNNNRINVIN